MMASFQSRQQYHVKAHAGQTGQVIWLPRAWAGSLGAESLARNRGICDLFTAC